jgi:2,5-diamino-6-(ribosylamino)-4(3H)-pyrimidinone 5'-phosphate reductase
VHSAISVDGRMDSFGVDVGLYYELSERISHEVVLSGSGTILAAARSAGVDMQAEDEPSAKREAAAARPLLAIVDSAGSIRRFAWLHAGGHWRDVVVLCTEGTPASHLERLRRLGVAHHIVGGPRVALGTALVLLGDRYGARTVRADAGPGLIGALIRSGLADELSVVLSPHLVGARGEPALHLADHLDRALSLKLESAEQLRDDHLWLRYVILDPE